MVDTDGAGVTDTGWTKTQVRLAAVTPDGEAAPLAPARLVHPVGGERHPLGLAELDGADVRRPGDVRHPSGIRSGARRGQHLVDVQGDPILDVVATAFTVDEDVGGRDR